MMKKKESPKSEGESKGAKVDKMGSRIKIKELVVAGGLSREEVRKAIDQEILSLAGCGMNSGTPRLVRAGYNLTKPPATYTI